MSPEIGLRDRAEGARRTTDKRHDAGVATQLLGVATQLLGVAATPLPLQDRRVEIDRSTNP
jgi:hypothetical protein